MNITLSRVLLVSSAAIISTALVVFFTPTFSQAQGEDTGTASSVYCPNLSITMQKCDPNRPLSQQRCTDATTQGQVTELQKFLSDYYDLNPDDYVTGYFGRLTRQNVQRFQCEKMNICSGDEATTGWGVVGPRTRAVIRDACGTQTQPTPPPSQPPASPAPTCTLSVSPTSIQSGGFAVLSWTSQHATTRTLDHGIGEVAGAGTHLVTNITNTATYTMTVTGQGGIGSCSATLTVIAPPPAQQSCSFNNQTIPDGQSVTAYQSSSVPNGQQCVSQTRTCTNGTLSGSYQYPTCLVQAAPPMGASCTTPWGTTVADGQTAQGFCPDPPSQGACGITKICRNGQWQTWCPSGYKLCPAAGAMPEYCLPETNQCTILSGPSSTPSIAITAPQSGASVALGSTLTISWVGSAPNGASVHLALFCPFQTLEIANNQGVTGSYTWTVPTTLYPAPCMIDAALVNAGGKYDAKMPISVGA